MITKTLLQKIAKRISKKKIFITKSLLYKRSSHPLPLNLDYIREATLVLCCEEIISNNINGNIAELGVYKGNFAKSLNFMFPTKKLYLFDTFEGFDRKDIEMEKMKGFSKGDQDFSDTSVEIVLRKMPHPEQCIIRKGFFPETAVGVEDAFCFVSIDTDLYDPIIKGLKFFYPRLEKGGFIFIHDFNNNGYLGAREAVLQFCKANNIGFVPIPDSGGTAIITK